MYFSDSERDAIRNCEYSIHCHEVVIQQEELEDGFKLNGYGIIKMESNGNIVLEFVCTGCNKSLLDVQQLPEDKIDQKQNLRLQANAIGGTVFESSNFSFYTPSFGGSILPRVYYIALPKITFLDGIKSDKEVLYMEMSHKSQIPPNHKNETKSTYGRSTLSWNQTNLNHEGIDIRFIQHSEHLEISAIGKKLDVENIKNSITLYLGLSSGSLATPYYERIERKGEQKGIIYSTHKRTLKNFIPPPLSQFVHDDNRNLISDSHYELFYNILSLSRNERQLFDSVFSNWKRVWYSFMSPVLSVQSLTLSISIEGILNDAYIPLMERWDRSKEDEKEKEKVLELVNQMSGLSEKSISRLCSQVGAWGKYYPKKVLERLKEAKAIEEIHITSWISMRNAATHPRLSEENEIKKRKDLQRVTRCLGLFYRLILNIFSYCGPMNAFEEPRERKFIMYSSVRLTRD